MKKSWTITDQILFTKRLSLLIEAHMPLAQAITLIANQSRKPLQPLFHSIARSIREGQSLSASLATLIPSASTRMIQIIKAGEHHGLLKSSLEYLSYLLEQERISRYKIISALMYPAMIACGTVGLSLFLIGIILPKMKQIFQSLHATLPFSTRFVLSASDFVQAYGFYILGFMIICVAVSIYSLKKYRSIQLYKDTILLSLPLIGSTITHVVISQFFRTFGTMLESHIAIDTAFFYSSESLSNVRYRLFFSNLGNELRSGSSLSKLLATNHQLVPNTVVELVAIGEQSGSLPSTCMYITSLYTQELEDRLKFLTSLLEPCLMIVMGLVVGFIALSIITPIYGITQNLKP